MCVTNHDLIENTLIDAGQPSRMMMLFQGRRSYTHISEVMCNL